MSAAAARARAIPLTDADDPRLAPYRAIRERDLRRDGDRFVAEGKVVVAMLAGAPGFAAESLLVLESRLPGMAAVIARLDPAVPVYVAGRAIVDAVVGFPVHRGVLAIGRRPQPRTADALLAGLPRRALVLTLVGIANHDNVGGLFRNAAAFGADAVLLDETCCDPLYRKALRVSVGAVLRVPFAHGGSADALAATLAAHGFSALALSPRGRQEIAAVARPERAALLLGTEGAGLPEALLARLDTARIAMAPGFDSLNVAAAAAIALHRLSDVSSAAAVSSV